jgi:lactam utilization protein B
MKKLLILFAAVLFAAGAQAQDSSKSKTASAMSSHMKDCYMMKSGKMVMEKNGMASDMTKDVTLSNGTVVMKDGTVKTKDGKTITLKDGQCVYTNGKISMMSSSASSGKSKSLK